MENFSGKQMPINGSHLRNAATRHVAPIALAALAFAVGTRVSTAGDFFMPDFLVDVTDIHEETTRTFEKFGSQRMSGMMQYPSTVLVAGKGVAFVEHSATCSEPVPAQNNFRQDKGNFEGKVVYDIHPTVGLSSADFSLRCDSYKGSYRLTYKTNSIQDNTGTSAIFEQRLEGRSRDGDNQTQVVSGRLKLLSVSTPSQKRNIDFGDALPCEYETQLVSVTTDNAGRTLSRHTRKFRMTGKSKCIMRQLPK